MSWTFKFYLAFGFLLAGYTALGFVASHSPTITIRLSSGESASTTFLRLVDGQLEARAIFNGRGRRELGGFDPTSPSRRIPNEEVANVEIDISNDQGEVLRYRAEPASGVGANSVMRRLVAVQDNEEEIQYLPYKRKRLALHAGMNRLQFSIIRADNKIKNETIEIICSPALGVKNADSRVISLWFSFLWPIYSIIYIVILMLWHFFNIKKRKKKQQEIAP